MTLQLDVRPKVRKEVRVTTDIDSLTAEQLAEVCKQRACTRSEFVRALILAYLEEHEAC